MVTIESSSCMSLIPYEPSEVTLSRSLLRWKSTEQIKLQPKIYTSKITTLANLKILAEIATNWTEKAKMYCRAAKSPDALSHGSLRELKKSLHVIDDIEERLIKLVQKKELDQQFAETSVKLTQLIEAAGGAHSTLGAVVVDQLAALKQTTEKSLNPIKDYAVYVAHDTKNVQGIVLKLLDEDDSEENPSVEIEHIATHPDNVANPAKKIRGVGTALINHIVSDMKQSKEADTLYLYSLATSVDFYKKIGLAVSESDSDSDSESDSDNDVDDDEIDNQKKMCLASEKVDSFLRTHSPVAQMLTVEPVLCHPAA